MNYNNLSLDTALSREFSKMGVTVKGLTKKRHIATSSRVLYLNIGYDVIKSSGLIIDAIFGRFNMMQKLWEPLGPGHL